MVTKFPQKWRPKVIANLSNLEYMPARLKISQWQSNNSSFASFGPLEYQTGSVFRSPMYSKLLKKWAEAEEDRC